MSLKYENVNLFWSLLIVEEFVRNKIIQFCISPGSRSSPLTYAVSQNKNVQKNIFYDERAAAFYALGYARATGKPAVLICTSGTAIANYLPAVVEACQDKLPLIVLSADRPPELQDTGANQTIEQNNIFGKYCKWQFCFPCPTWEILPQQVLTTIDQATYQAILPPHGVVHLNCMFREPLISNEFSIESIKQHFQNDKLFYNWCQQKNPYTKYYTPTLCSSLEHVTEIIKNSKKGIIVIGKIDSFVDISKICDFVLASNWLVWPDISSGNYCGSNIIHHFDLLLLQKHKWSDYKADTILHLGGQLVSKRYLEFVAQCPPENYIVVKNSNDRYDPNHIVTMHVQTDLNDFAQKMILESPFSISTDWQSQICLCEQTIKENKKALLHQQNSLNELSTVHTLSQHLPENSGLFLGNSMTIRYFDMFTQKTIPVKIAANRGVSGIDGNLATALGFSQGLQQPVTAVLGDLTLIHDLNSLLLVQNSKYPIFIILLNNHGGSIFAHLPIAQNTEIFSQYFLTPHNLQFENIAKSFHVDYFAPKTNSDFIDFYLQATKTKKSCLIEVITDYKTNLELHKKICSSVCQ